jgi:hypothetical protein
VAYRKIVYDAYPYLGTDRTIGCCRVRIFTSPALAPVVLVSARADNPGQPITAAAEILYPRIIARYLPGWLDDAERLTLIEHVPGRPDGAGHRVGQTFDQVRFGILRPVIVTSGSFLYVTFAAPWRVPLSELAVALLLGVDVLERHGEELPRG